MTPILETNLLSKAEIQSLTDKESLEASSGPKLELRCPIDNQHIISISRLDSHLTNCRRRNVHLGQKKCPFNEYHFITPELLSEHVNNCPDRRDATLPTYGKDSRMIDRQIAVIQMVELKLQCGLPVAPADLDLYHRRGEEIEDQQKRDYLDE